MKDLSKHNPTKLLDLLNARLHYERTGVKLYDSVISKIGAQNDADAQQTLGQLREHRNQEKEHEEWLESHIRLLGGDPHRTSDMARLEARESRGTEDIILDGDNDMLHLFHALLAAELVDNAQWDLLVQLADEAGDGEAKSEFKKRLDEEEEHLVFARRVLDRLTRRIVLGERVEMPTSP